MSVATAQIEMLRKVEGTAYWHVDQWFDSAADYAELYDAKNAVAEMRELVELTPNRSNLERLRLLIDNKMENGVLKSALLLHIDAILLRKISGFGAFFSRTNQWRSMIDISATSCFFNSFGQALNYCV